MSEDHKLKTMYQTESRESSPEHLDRKILAMAGQKRPRDWQPFALAATVLLALSVVLNLGLFAPDATNDLQETMADSGSVDNAEQSVAETLAERPTSAMQESDVTAAPAFAAQSGSPVVEVRQRSAADLARAIEDTQDTTQNVEGLDSFFAESARLKHATPKRHCSDAESAAAGSWYQCVLALRDEGLEKEADHEQALLLTKFPTFKIR